MPPPFRLEVALSFLIIVPPMLMSAAAHAGEVAGKAQALAEARKKEYVRKVTRGAGFMPWQDKAKVSEAEKAFREQMEQRKTDMLAGRYQPTEPVLITPEELAILRERVKTTEEGKQWFADIIGQAKYVADQPDEFVEQMVPMQTPANIYGYTCPNCVGEKSQEGAGKRFVHWNYRDPEKFSCELCGQVFPDEKFPETATLVCPRRGQTFTYYLNPREQASPEDRTGNLAYRWAGHPYHDTFSGLIRIKKAGFSIYVCRRLGLAYAVTGEARYARRCAQMLTRLAECYRNWLYHDYWDTIVDADPLYAAWHPTSLPIEWKRHLTEKAYARDTMDKAAMLQTYWGSGRYWPSTDSITTLSYLALAYDLVRDATYPDGRSVWQPGEKEKVERDLLMEWAMGAEPYLGGIGKAGRSDNKSPRIYMALASVAMCLGLPDWADVAERGYRQVARRSFGGDGFSHESPSYNNMYLGTLLRVPETLHGFTWPEGYKKRTGTINLYETSPILRLMLLANLEISTPNCRLVPLADTTQGGAPLRSGLMIGAKRYPDTFAGVPHWYQTMRGGAPDEYMLTKLDEKALDNDKPVVLRERLFPIWKTALLRNGQGPDASLLTFSFQHWGGHRHKDNLSVFYQDRGRRILGDLGYIGDTPMNRWIKTARSHNLVVVDNAEQSTKRAPALNLAFFSPLVSVVEAESNAYPQCKEYRRMVALVKGPEGATFMVDIFRVAGGKRHAFQVFSELAASDTEDGSISFTGLTMPPEPPLPDFKASTKSEHIYGLRDVRQVEQPPALWSATWKDTTGAYRLHLACQVDAVEASNGPGQERLKEIGRRVRYVNAVREEKDRSTFVAVHEPGNPDGTWAIRQIERLPVPAAAGPDAVALRIDSAWGEYLLLTGFAKQAKVAGVSFKGAFGLLREEADGGWTMVSAAVSTFRRGDDGFAAGPDWWASAAEAHTADSLTAKGAPPEGFPTLPAGCTSFAIMDTGYQTGYTVNGFEEKTIGFERFPLPNTIGGFRLPAVRLIEGD